MKKALLFALFFVVFAAVGQSQTTEIGNNKMEVTQGKADLQLEAVSYKTGLRMMANQIPSRQSSNFTWLGKSCSITYDGSYKLEMNGQNQTFQNKGELTKYLLSQS